MSKYEREVENKEIVTMLKASPASKLVKVLMHEPSCYTSTGRINLSATARHLGVRAAKVTEMIQKVQELKPSFFGKS